MPGILIKHVPPALHRKLKSEAKRHRRSMTNHALVLLERAVARSETAEWPEPVRGAFPLTDRWLKKAIRAGRA